MKRFRIFIAQTLKFILLNMKFLPKGTCKFQDFEKPEVQEKTKDSPT